jgi:REP element-mobilizing transposase RayT
VARALRIQVAGGTYHVATRGNNRRAIFTCADDRELFLRLLEIVVRRMRWRLHVYCLMGNHYHLLIETTQPNLAQGMQYLNGAYARIFNELHRRRDHLFGRRYRSVHVIREEHFVWLTRYIVRNPVREGWCDSPGGWGWSSFNATVGDAERPAFLSVAWVLARFGTDHATARPRYRAYAEEFDGPVPKGLVLIDP